MHKVNSYSDSVFGSFENAKGTHNALVMIQIKSGLNIKRLIKVNDSLMRMSFELLLTSSVIYVNKEAIRKLWTVENIRIIGDDESSEKPRWVDIEQYYSWLYYAIM